MFISSRLAIDPAIGGRVKLSSFLKIAIEKSI